MSHQHHREHHLEPEEEAKLIEEYKEIIKRYDAASKQSTLPETGNFRGLKGNYRKDWEKQIKEMKSRVERYTREHGKHGRSHHR